MFDIKVVIPSYNEPHLKSTLDSLANCYKPQSMVEVIVVINHHVHSKDDIITNNQQTLAMAKGYKSNNFYIDVAIYELEKQSVGMARKIGMDMAYSKIKKNDNLKNGLIINLDADCTVASNYLIALENHFLNHPKTPAASIYYEHQLSDNQHIIDYELHLRYITNALRWTGHPYAYQTVGSCMAARAEAYHKQGGMNTKQAGEDFYFLQKMMDLGNFSDILDTTVFPSDRISDRVPFGTGRAMDDMKNKNQPWNSYHFDSYIDIKNFISQTQQMYEGKFPSHLSAEMFDYLISNNFEIKIKEIKSNTSHYQAFKKRFFHWFNGFMVMKYLNFVREKQQQKQTIEEAILPFFAILFPNQNPKNNKEMLLCMRNFDKNRGQYVYL